MVILLQGAEVFAPERLGQQDILIEGQQITYIGEVPVEAVTDLPHASVIDARGLTAVPGFIDPHVLSPVAVSGTPTTPEISSTTSSAPG